ncbi:MAG: hypothetical protein IPP79_07460 [Chitinophagaceae bacterium]|nr:hypothetical protein [Chitinophagaceae bacterium]
MKKIRIFVLLAVILITSGVMAQQEQFNKIIDNSNNSFGFIGTYWTRSSGLYLVH